MARVREGWLLVALVWAGAVTPAEPASRSVAPAPGRGVFFVAPNGRDTWSGQRPAPNRAGSDGPFATLARAKDAVRRLKADRGSPLDHPVTVYLRRGTYFLQAPLVFTPEDSGTPGNPITYRAYGDGPVVVSGGRRIIGWEPVTRDGKRLWAAPVPEAREGRWFFRQLFVNGQRRARARHPDRGYLRVDAVPDATPQTPWHEGQTRFGFERGDLDGWKSARGGEVVVMTRWVESHLPIADLDPAERRLAFGKRSVFRLEPGDPYYVEHVFEALDSPGEWFLDRDAGRLYYKPLPGERMRRAQVIAPALTQLIRFEGSPEAQAWVEHLVFQELTFSHAEWWFPERFQAPWPRPDVGGFPQAAVGVPGALYAEGARDLSLDRCTVAHVGTYGIELGRGCQRNRIASCRLFDLGAGGVKIGETALREGQPERTHGNTVTDCHIHDGGRIFHSAVGIWIGQSFDNRIARNHVHDFYYTGLSVGWTWGYGPALAERNVVEENHVHHIGVRSDGDGPILSDMGGIYTLGCQPGTVIRGNRFHDIAGLRYGGWGIYLDEGSSEILVEKNLVYRTTHGGFHQHYGRENLIRNNIFALGRDAQIQRTRPEPHRSFTFERNIVYWREGSLLAGNLSELQFLFDHNLYWREGGGEVRFGDRSWEAWREAGMDRNSRVADPLFVAVEKEDWRLRPGSPAFGLGFVAIDVATGPASGAEGSAPGPAARESP